MTERWLHTNRRAALVSTILAAGLLAGLNVGGRLLAGGLGRPIGLGAWAVVGIVDGLILAGWCRFAWQPRLRFRNGKLLIHIRYLWPVSLPVEVVECIFLGRNTVPWPEHVVGALHTLSVVVRLAERAEPWRQGSVNPLLAQWRDGYITLRGEWCEPLDGPLLQQLNQRLLAVRPKPEAGQPVPTR